MIIAKNANGLGQLMDLHLILMLTADARLKALLQLHLNGNTAQLAHLSTMDYVEATALSVTGLGQKDQTGKTQMLTVDAKLKTRKLFSFNEIQLIFRKYHKMQFKNL